MAGPTQEEIQEYFDNQGSFGSGDNGDPVPSFDPFSSGGISTVGPSGTVYQEYKTLKSYLQTVFGPLPEGAVGNTWELRGASHCAAAATHRLPAIRNRRL